MCVSCLVITAYLDSCNTYRWSH